MDKDEEIRQVIHRVLLYGVGASGALMAAGLLGSPDGDNWMRAGILLLMATPAARVALLAAGYARRRRWGFFWVSALVLVLLGAGVLMGVRH